MQRILDYRKNAADCRAQAAKAPAGGARDAWLEMATRWDELAEGRTILVQQQQQQQQQKPPPQGEDRD
jgi:hypothetical protein